MSDTEIKNTQSTEKAEEKAAEPQKAVPASDGKKMSRKDARLSIVCMFAGLLLESFMRDTMEGIGLGWVGWLILLVGVVFYYKASKCPHCGRSSHKLLWSKPNAGTCKKCGMLMEYDR